MAAIYGMFVALPVVWGCAGYVLVSQPGTAEPMTRGRPRNSLRTQEIELGPE